MLQQMPIGRIVSPFSFILSNVNKVNDLLTLSFPRV